ncbi:hypothetical protein MO867_10750 [Microbulbifer sp. OS29]|uniref:Uncharacterized protein n=1 Tax=Microbulbifer okhotskensis TaxID=2926617 RepID=A0A9X2EM71_9GAMM|nr:hypothetical protein [Microbulbifer okhotskensis]MCO1334819.1 hypothetical protein [Microbulbifer okhotskensis]
MRPELKNSGESAKSQRERITNPIAQHFDLKETLLYLRVPSTRLFALHLQLRA